MDASPGGYSTPPPWHIDAVGGRPHHQGDLPRPHIPSLVSTFPARVSYPPPLVFLKASNSRAASASLTQKLVFRTAASRLDSSKMVCHEIQLCGGQWNGTVYRAEGPYFNCP